MLSCFANLAYRIWLEQSSPYAIGCNMYKVTVFSAKRYDKEYLIKSNRGNMLQFDFVHARLSAETVMLAQHSDAICIFVNDIADNEVLQQLAQFNIKIIALRCAGFNNVDIKKAKSLGIKICRVPEYSPEAVAEHTVGLILTLSRKFHKAYNRVKEGNFSLDGLMGFNLHNRTVGLVGTGHIGLATLKILAGFGCKLLCSDPTVNKDALALGATYLSLDDLFQRSDIISLHCPLTNETKHMVDTHAINQMKPGVVLINTSRGGLIDTTALIDGLKQKKIAQLGLDVYELESDLFFEDLSDTIIDDDIFQRLVTFPNVLITGHQGFFTEEALTTIAETTVENLITLLAGQHSENQLV